MKRALKLSKQRIKIVLALAVAIIIAAAVFVTVFSGRTRLVLSDEDSGEVYLKLPISDGGRFSLTYTHSVHKTPVTEVYEVRGKDIYVVEARFHTFGAGMQTEYPDGVELSYDDDGTIVLTGYNTLCPHLVYGVGRIADYVLNVGDDEYVLADICGRNKFVLFSIK